MIRGLDNMVMELLNELEVLEIAKGIEETGYNFYKKSAESFEGEEIKEIFEYLAMEEQEHIKTFERVKDKVVNILGDNKPECFEESISAYLNAISETAVFNVNGITANSIDSIKSPREALLIGLQAEKDSILFYEIVLANTKEDMTKKVLERLIKEEVKHLHDIKGLLDQLK